MQSFVDATFFRGRRAYTESIQNFTHELNSAFDLNAIGRTLRKQINSTLGRIVFTSTLMIRSTINMPPCPPRMDAPAPIFAFIQQRFGAYFAASNCLYIWMKLPCRGLKVEQARLAC